jgi:hypothetical protein
MPQHETIDHKYLNNYKVLNTSRNEDLNSVDPNSLKGDRSIAASFEKFYEKNFKKIDRSRE